MAPKWPIVSSKQIQAYVTPRSIAEGLLLFKPKLAQVIYTLKSACTFESAAHLHYFLHLGVL